MANSEQVEGARVSEIRARCDAATDGPWTWSGPTSNEVARGEHRVYVHRLPGCGDKDIPPEKFFVLIHSLGNEQRDGSRRGFHR